MKVGDIGWGKTGYCFFVLKQEVDAFLIYIFESKRKIWVDEEMRTHRVLAPAYIGPSGSIYWYRHGQLHREDGPAFKTSVGEEEWYFDGMHVPANSICA